MTVRGQGWPVVGRGQSVGLLGGSFDPAHMGHVHVTREALKRFGLDWVWWLVSPGNPLKAEGPAALDRRMARARQLMEHPRVRVTDVETRMGTRFTAETLDGLQARYPDARFVWLMGADNLADFHHWENWRHIARSVPLGILARPGQRISARRSVAAGVFRMARLHPQVAPLLPGFAPPAWCFLNIPMRADSSTEIRHGGGWWK